MHRFAGALVGLLLLLSPLPARPQAPSAGTAGARHGPSAGTVGGSVASEGGFFLIDLCYAWPNACRGLGVDNDGDPTDCTTTPDAGDSICPGANETGLVADLDSGSTHPIATVGRGAVINLGPTARGSAYKIDATDTGPYPAISGNLLDNDLNTWVCRDSVTLQPCTSGTNCQMTIPGAKGYTKRVPAVLHRISTDEFWSLEIGNLNLSTDPCQFTAVPLSTLGLARAPVGGSLSYGGRATGDTTLTDDYEFATLFADHDHYTGLGFEAMGEWAARAKYETAYFPSDAANLIDNGRAESDCSGADGISLRQGGTPGTETLAQTTIDYDDATVRAFRRNGCELTSRDEAGDGFTLGPMQWLQSYHGSSSPGPSTDSDSLYVAHFVASCDQPLNGGSPSAGYLLRVVDDDTGTASTFITSEATGFSHDGANGFKVWFDNGFEWEYAADGGSNQAEVAACNRAHTSPAESVTQYVVVFEVEDCRSNNCIDDASGENFDIELYTSGGTEPLMVDEAFAYRKYHQDGDLHNLLGDGLYRWIGASNNVRDTTACDSSVLANGCDGMSGGIYNALVRHGRTIAGSLASNLIADNGTTLEAELLGLILQGGTSRIGYSLRTPAPKYLHVNLTANDLQGATANGWERQVEWVRKLRWEAQDAGTLVFFTADPRPYTQTSFTQGPDSMRPGESWDRLLDALLSGGVHEKTPR